MAKPPKKKKAKATITYDMLGDNQFLRKPTSGDGFNLKMSPDYSRYFDPLSNYGLREQVTTGLDFLDNWYSKRGYSPDLSNTQVQVKNMPPNQLGEYSTGAGQSGMPKGVYLNSDLLINGRGSLMTAVHEINHQAQLTTPEIKKNIQQISKVTGLRPEAGDWEKRNFDYLSRPEEFHSRMMEFREYFGIDPRDKFNKKTLGSIKNYIDQIPTDSPEKELFNSLYNVVPKEEDFIKLMNKVATVTDFKPVNNAQQGGFTYNDRLREYFGKRKTAFNPQQVPNGGPILAPFAKMLSLFGKTPEPAKGGLHRSENLSFLSDGSWAPRTFGELGQDEMRKQWAEKTESEEPFNGEMYSLDEPSTNLTEGLLRGAKIPKRLIQDVKTAGTKHGVDPFDILAVAAAESTFGYGPFGSKRVNENTIDAKGLFTYNDFTVKAPKTFEEFAFDKGRKVDHSVSGMGHDFSVSGEEKENLYNDNDLRKEYVKYLSKFKDSPEQNSVIDLVAQRIAKKGISAINPGESTYTGRVLQYKEMLKNNRTPIKFQQGGYASGDPLNFMFPSSGLVPSYAKDGLSGYFEDPLMLPHAGGGGFFGKVWKGIKNGFGAAGDQLLSFAGMPNVIQNSVYDQQAPQWLQKANSAIGGVATGVLGAVIPGAGLGLSALQGLGNRSQGQQGGFGGQQMDFSSLFGGGQQQQDTNQYNVGSLLQGLMGGSGGQQSFTGQNPQQQQQFGTALGQLFGNFQGRGGFGGGINPFGTPGFNPQQPRMYEDGGEVQQGPAMIPIQTEKGEVFVHLDGSITPVNAKKTHKQMDEDEVTDVVPEGTYVTSNDKKIRMTLKDAEEIVMGLKALPYEEFTKGKLPEEILFSEIFGNTTKKMTPAEMTQKILRKFPTMDRSSTWNKNDIFTEITNKENMNNRLPWLEQVIQFNESRRGKSPQTQTFKHGGVVKMDGVRHLPKGGSVKKFGPGDWVSTAATALPFFMDLFGGKNKNSNIDPLARNMILGSAPLYSAGLNANINSQNNQLGQAIQDFTGLGQNLNNFAGAQAGANIAGRALQQTDFKNFDPLLQDQRLANFNTRTPNAVIDALSTPRYDLNALAGTLGPRAFGNFTSQMMNSENETRNNAIVNQFNADRGLGLNVLGQRNALDSFSQQFNIGQGEKQQQARNAQTAGIFGDVGSYFGRLGDIQSQILPITTQFALQKAQLAGQKQMGTAQNLMNTGSIYAQLAGNNQGQQQQQQQMKQTGNYDFLKNIILQNQQQTQQQIGTIGQNRAMDERFRYDVYNPYQYPQQLSTVPQFTPRNSWDPYGGG